jgi:hypothetical protein
MNRSLCFAGLIALGGAAGWALPGAPRAVHGSTASAPSANLSLCRGGDDGHLGVTLEPRQVIADGKGREALALSLHLTSRFDGPARARYGVELVDDRGKAYQAPSLSGLIGLDRRGAEGVADLRTPDGLPDGLYKLRVTAVAKGAGADASEVVHLYLRVAGGAIQQLAPEEYHKASRENMAVE